MKEASGELNLTVVVVMAVAALMAFFYTLIWPMLRNNISANTKCQAAVCEKCDTSANPNGCPTVQCHYKGETFNCVWKG